MPSSCRSLLRIGLLLLVSAGHLRALSDQRSVHFEPVTDGVTLVAEGRAVPLVVAPSDWPGVLRAAGDLQKDVERVTQVRPELAATRPADANQLVIVGTIGRSPVLEELVRAGKLEVDDLRGKWESYLHQVVNDPWPGVERALVIAGSDKRGTIYGIYELSEQIGVSPWYWWADVPVTPRRTVAVAPGRRVQGEPVVKYRGIFINDEAPALTGWVHEKFGAFDHTFYRHVFELILRLRGNYLWPAMWQPRAFNDDDPRNPQLADEYGIVMGTSHHEPLMRAHDEWNRYGEGPWDYARNAERLREFWRGGVERVKDYEQIVSLGMRGDGDEPMSEEANVALLEQIVADQRGILRDVMGRPLEQIPQLWALYKEVQGYYERGMRVPDDVTLLWADDNWGNIRRLPTAAERQRPGAAGVYYHFDYVGGPRNYKWINTTPIQKVWEQMHLAWQYDANRIWIVNVGDIKPMEFPIEFFLTYAWDPARWPYERLDAFTRAWATREFGAEHAAEIAALINGYTRLNGRRKPEMIAPDTLSLVNYREAERVLAEWQDLTIRAERLHARLPEAAQSAFFQLVLYPVKASGVVQAIHVAAGRNRWYAVQGRAATTTEAARVRELFALDARLVDEYHALRDGRWNHLMSQSKMGYTYWQTPNLEIAPAVSEAHPLEAASPALALEGSERSWPSYGAGPAILPPLHALGQGTRWIELFNRGQQPFSYEVTADVPWVEVSPARGTVDEVSRLEVGVDWTAVPRGDARATLTLRAGTATFTVQLPVENPDLARAVGFVETDRHVAIEAPHYHRAVEGDEITWQPLPGFGRTVGGVTAFPVTAPDQTPGGTSPHLAYDVTLTSTGPLRVEVHCAPSLDFQPDEGLRFAVSFDDQPPQIVKVNTWATLQSWEKAVGDSITKVVTTHTLAQPGPHVLKLWLVTPGVVFQRIVIDAGGVRPSYLGPPESPQARAER